MVLHLEGRVRGCHEQSEKQIFQAERTVHKKMWNTEHEQAGVRSEIPSVLWPRSMGFILRAVAGYEDFGSVHTFESGLGRRDSSGQVSQAPLAVSPVQWWASGFRFLDSMPDFPTAVVFFLSWLAFILRGELQMWDVEDS